MKIRSSKPQRRWPKDGRLDQRISRSNSNTTALHSVCTIIHKNGNIQFFWKLNYNIHNRLLYGIFAFLVHFAAKILQFLEFLGISCYLETILKNVKSLEISWKFLRDGSTVWIWTILIQPMASHERMKYGTVQIINLHRPTQVRLLEDSKLKASKRKRWNTRRQKTRSMDQPIKLKHYCTTQCLHSNTRMEILKFFGNWIIIFIIDYFMEFSLF